MSRLAAFLLLAVDPNSDIPPPPNAPVQDGFKNAVQVPRPRWK